MPITYDQSGVTYDSTTYTYDGEIFSPSVFPVAGVFVAWDDGPYVASPNWTEVTTDVRRFSIHRGRSSDFEQFETGTAQIVFNNRERKYDPFYTSGSLYGKLLPRRQVRVTAQIGGVLYEVYRGYIAGWPVTWSEYGQDSTVTVQCFDALGLMVDEQVPSDWLTDYTASLNPYWYFTGSGSRGVGYLDSYDGTSRLTNASASLPNFYEVPALLEGVQGTAKFLPYYAAYRTKATTARADFTISGYAQFLGGVDFFAFVGTSGIQYGDTLLYFQYYYETFAAFQKNYLYIRIIHTAAGTSFYYRSDFTTSQSQGLFYSVVYNGTTNTPRLFINGTESTLVNIGADPSGGSTLDPQDAVFFLNEAISQFSVVARQLTTSEITTLHQFAQARIQETTTARMNRLVGKTSYPTALTAFTSSPAASVSAIGQGSGVIPEMQLVADSEGGEMFVSKAGALTMTNRTDVFNATRSKNVQATITDSGVGLRYGQEVEIQYAGDDVVNDVTIGLADDSEIYLVNNTTIAAYGAKASTIETLLSDVGSALSLGLMELGVEGVLVPQISPIDVSSNTAAADWQTILGLELLDRVTFKRTPTVGNQFSRDALINAIDHQVEPGVWRSQLTLSMRYTSPLTCDDSVLGKVDYNYCG
jgi:hypothetical protein